MSEFWEKLQLHKKNTNWLVLYDKKNTLLNIIYSTPAIL